MNNLYVNHVWFFRQKCAMIEHIKHDIKKTKKHCIKLDELKELPENLTSNIDTEHENKLNFNIDVKYPLLAEYGDLLHLLNRYSCWYKKHFVTAW